MTHGFNLLTTIRVNCKKKKRLNHFFHSPGNYTLFPIKIEQGGSVLNEWEKQYQNYLVIVYLFCIKAGGKCIFLRFYGGTNSFSQRYIS